MLSTGLQFTLAVEGGRVKWGENASCSPVQSVTSVIRLFFMFFCNLKYLMPTQNKAETIIPHEWKRIKHSTHKS